MNRSLTLITGLCCLLTACTGGEKLIEAKGAAAPKPTEAARRSSVEVEVFEVSPTQVTSQQLVPAAVSVERQAMILAQRDGIILNLTGEEGKKVGRGEIIGRLNDEDTRSQLQQADLEATRSAIEERQYEAMVRVNRSELEEETALAEQGLSSKRQVNRAQYKLDVATEELERTRLTTRAAKVKVEGVKLEIEKAVVRAPLDGVITRCYVKLGAGVVKNDKLFEVAQLRPLQVRFQLAQGEETRVGRGTTVELTAPESDRIIARARVRRVEPVADAASNTIGYLADVIGGSNLIPGAAVNVRVPRLAKASTHWVPRSAFPSIADPGRGAATTLFVVLGDKSAARAVWIGRVEGDQVEVSSGLETGDRVILSPPAELKAGDQIAVRRP